MKNSTAYELHDLWQRANGENKVLAKKKLDLHMQGVEQVYKKMHGETPSHLENYKMGDHPEDWK